MRQVRQVGLVPWCEAANFAASVLWETVAPRSCCAESSASRLGPKRLRMSTDYVGYNGWQNRVTASLLDISVFHGKRVPLQTILPMTLSLGNQFAAASVGAKARELSAVLLACAKASCFGCQVLDSFGLSLVRLSEARNAATEAGQH